jgi:hypothetical protein
VSRSQRTAAAPCKCCPDIRCSLLTQVHTKSNFGMVNTRCYHLEIRIDRSLEGPSYTPPWPHSYARCTRLSFHSRRTEQANHSIVAINWPLAKVGYISSPTLQPLGRFGAAHQRLAIRWPPHHFPGTTSRRQTPASSRTGEPWPPIRCCLVLVF